MKWTTLCCGLPPKELPTSEQCSLVKALKLMLSLFLSLSHSLCHLLTRRETQNAGHHARQTRQGVRQSGRARAGSSQGELKPRSAKPHTLHDYLTISPFTLSLTPSLSLFLSSISLESCWAPRATP